MDVGRPKKNPNETLVEVPCKVPPDIASEIANISISTDRSRSQIARKLILRGLASYRRDGSLDEPGETTITKDDQAELLDIVGKKLEIIGTGKPNPQN